MFGSGMGMPPVVAHLMADIGEFTAKMGEADALITGITTKGARNWSKMGKQAMGIGMVMVAASGALAYETVKMASHFQTQMERVHTQAGASQKEVDTLRSKVLALAGATGQGPEKLAESLYHVESVGYRGAAAMSVLDQAARLASISGASLDETTYGLTSVMQSYGAKAQDAAKWAAFFNGVVGIGDMRMQDFVKSVGTGFFSAAQTFGVSAQTAGAALAFMTDRGQHADSAATHLRMSIALMAAPSQKATTILKSLGLASHEAANAQQVASGVLKKAGMDYSSLAADLKKPDGFVVALSHLKKGLEDSGLSAEAANAQLSHAFGGGKSDSTILAMLNNLGTLHSKYVALGAASSKGNFAESWAASQKTFAVETAKAKASLAAFGITIGTILMPYAEKFLAWLTKAAGYLNAHAGAAKAVAIAIGVVLATGLVIATAGMIAFAVASIAATWEILLIIAAIMLVVAAVYFLVTHWGQVWDWIKTKTGQAAGWVRDKVVGAWNAVKDWTVRVWNAITQKIRDVWDAIASWISNAWHTVTDPIVDGWHWLENTTTAVWGRIKAFFTEWWPLLMAVFTPWLFLLASIWQHTHTAVEGFVKGVWNRVTGFFKTTWRLIETAAHAAWAQIHKRIVDPITAAWRWVTQVASSIWHTLVGWWNRVAASASSIWNTVYNTLARWLSNMLRPVTTFASSLWTTIVNGFNAVLNWLSGVRSWFSNVGLSIIYGIGDGIDAGWNWLTGKVSNLAHSLLDAAKSALSVNSPSKRFRDVIGRAIPEGIAEGVATHGHLARSAVRSLSHSLLGSGSGSFALAGAGAGLGGGGGTLNLHLTTEAKVDGKVLFEITQKHALRYQQRNGQQAFAR